MLHLIFTLKMTITDGVSYLCSILLKGLVRPQCITSKLTNYDHPINPDFSSGCHGLLVFFVKGDVYKPYPHRHES